MASASSSLRRRFSRSDMVVYRKQVKRLERRGVYCRSAFTSGQAVAAEDDVVSGQVWDEFCETLKRSGRQILRPEAPVSALDRAEGWRYLTRLLRIGLEMHMEFADPDFPGFFAPSHENGKIGADNPDHQLFMAR